MSKRIDANLRKRDAAISAYRSLASRAKFYGLPHETILAETRAIFALIDSAPQYVKAYVSGYAQRERESWYEFELVYCHCEPATGRLYTLRPAAIRPAFCESVDPLYDAGRGAEIATWESKHYWIKASEREISHGRPAVAI